MSHDDPVTLQARLESAEQEANRLRSIVAGYEQMDTIPPPVAKALDRHSQQIENLTSQMTSIASKFEAYAQSMDRYSDVMERAAQALQQEPRCRDCPNRPLSLVPSQRGG